MVEKVFKTPGDRLQEGVLWPTLSGLVLVWGLSNQAE